MKEDLCNRELDILQAMQEDSWDDELKNHADCCSTCADLMLVQSFLRDDSAEALSQAQLPHACHVWALASRQAKQKAVHRALLPIALIEVVSWVVGFGVALAALWKWTPLNHLLSKWVESISLSLPGTELVTGSLMLLTAAGFLFLIIYALYLEWSEA